jgi:hypothetical protein
LEYETEGHHEWWLSPDGGKMEEQNIEHEEDPLFLEWQHVVRKRKRATRPVFFESDGFERSDTKICFCKIDVSGQ